MTLHCLSRYVSRNYAFMPGQVITDLSPGEEAWLLNDSPDSFARVIERRAVLEPPEHRAILEPEQHRTTAGEGVTHAGAEVMTPDNFGASKLPEHRAKRRRG